MQKTIKNMKKAYVASEHKFTTLAIKALRERYNISDDELFYIIIEDDTFVGSANSEDDFISVLFIVDDEMSLMAKDHFAPTAYAMNLESLLKLYHALESNPIKRSDYDNVVVTKK